LPPRRRRRLRARLHRARSEARRGRGRRAGGRGRGDSDRTRDRRTGEGHAARRAARGACERRARVRPLPMTARAMPRPNAGFLLAHPAHFVALGFGTGLAPFAPGTVGALLAFPLYALAAQWLSPGSLTVVIAFLFAVGVWACERCGRDLGGDEHG